MTTDENVGVLTTLSQKFSTGALAYVASRVALGLWPWVRPSTLHKYKRPGNPTWALITGSSGGIGLAFASELLQNGFNVILHGRSPEKLNRIKDELLERYPGRKIEIWVADASQDQVNFDEIVQLVEMLPGDLTLLINNVGGVVSGFPGFVKLEESTVDCISQTINFNARFMACLTARLLPILKITSPGGIVCCGSAAGILPMPYLVTYSATKAFLQAFCNSLKLELSCADVDVSVNKLLIGEVNTPGSPTPPSFFVIQPNELASAAVGNFGYEKILVAGYRRHALQFLILKLLPVFMSRRATVQILTKKRDEERQRLKAR